MSDALYHHGIKGQRWGIRRFQNPDGTLIDGGKRRKYKREARQFKRELRKAKRSGRLKKDTSNRQAAMNKVIKEARNTKEYKEFSKYDRELSDFLSETAKANGVKLSQISISSNDPLGAKHVALQKAAAARGKQIAQRHLNAVAKATDTEAARDLVKKMLVEEGYYSYFDS